MIYNTIISLYLLFIFSDPNLHQDVERLLKQKVSLIPLVMCIAWIIPSLYRISYLRGETLEMFTIIFAGCNGFLNSLVYASTSGTWDLFLMKFCWCFNRNERLKSSMKEYVLSSPLMVS